MRSFTISRHPGVTPLPARRCTRPSRLRCNAKGNQKNEGMYFEYRPAGKTKEQLAEEQKRKAQKEQQQFGWANTARSSVQQYRKAVNSQRPKKSSALGAKPYRPSQQQQAAQAEQQMEQEAPATTAAPTLQPKPVLNTPDAADTAAAAADTSPPPPAAAAAEAEAAEAKATEQPMQPPAAAAAATTTHTTSTSSSSSSKEATMQQRKQQMLQRMKGSAAVTTAAGPVGSTSEPIQQSAEQQAGAVAGAAAAAAAGAAVAAAWEKEPLMDTEGELLLQELIELAEQLSGPGGYNSVIDSDPLSDPLAGLFAEGGDSSLESVGFEGFFEAVGEDSEGLGLTAAGDFDDTEAEELFAAVAAMQQQARSAAAALAADDAMPDYATAGDIESSSRAGVVGSAAAELLAWEAEQAAGQQEIDIEAAAAAMQRGEVLGGDDEVEYEEGEEDEYEIDQEGEDWLENDPQLKKMMQADGAAFARMLAELNDDDTDSSSSNGSKAAAGGETQQESWADMEIEDWLVPAESASAAAAAGGELLSAVDEDGSEDSELAGLLGAITADPSLDQQAKMQAKLNIQGMFNDPSVAAGSSSRRQRSSSSSNRQQASSNSGAEDADRVLMTTGAVGAEQQELELRPKPVRPPVSE